MNEPDNPLRQITDEVAARSRRWERPLRILGYFLLIALGMWLGRTFK